MIRGHIEVITNEVVQGWIYSADGKIRDKTVLAFAGEHCVGSGTVEHFRSDLADAGLGDGYLGFSFGITVAPAAVGSVTVRLDGSDAVLLQRGALVRSPADEATRPPPEDRAALSPAAVDRQLAALTWSLHHARIGQADHDYLRLLWSVGVYERSLLRREAVGRPAVLDLSLNVATDLLEAYLGSDAEIEVIAAVTALNFRERLDAVLADPRLAPVVALCSTDRVGIRALAGSHVKAAAGGRRQSNYLDYTITAEHLVIIDSRVAAEVYSPAGQSIALVTAAPRVPAP